ncbi:hypothetical protein LX88_008440 [Lentzea californiensis]|nr:hypothetical protein [Lentzea californiensis]
MAFVVRCLLGHGAPQCQRPPPRAEGRERLSCGHGKPSISRIRQPSGHQHPDSPTTAGRWLSGGRAMTRDSKAGRSGLLRPVPLRLPDCRSTCRGQRSHVDWTLSTVHLRHLRDFCRDRETGARLRVSPGFASLAYGLGISLWSRQVRATVNSSTILRAQILSVVQGRRAEARQLRLAIVVVVGHTIGGHLHHRSVCACEAFTAAGSSHSEARPSRPLAIEQTSSCRRAVHVVGIVVEHDAVKAGAVVRISRWHGRFGLRCVDAAQHVPIVRIECRFTEWPFCVRGAVF